MGPYDMRAEMVRARMPARDINRISREIRRMDYALTPEENTETKRSTSMWKRKKPESRKAPGRNNGTESGDS